VRSSRDVCHRLFGPRSRFSLGLLRGIAGRLSAFVHDSLPSGVGLRVSPVCYFAPWGCFRWASSPFAKTVSQKREKMSTKNLAKKEKADKKFFVLKENN